VGGGTEVVRGGGGGGGGGGKKQNIRSNHKLNEASMGGEQQ